MIDMHMYVNTDIFSYTYKMHDKNSRSSLFKQWFNVNIKKHHHHE